MVLIYFIYCSIVGMAVEPTFSESLAGRNKRETAEPKRKPRSVISFPRLLCSSRSLKSRPPAKSRFRCLRIDPSGSSGGSSPEKSSPVQMPGASPHFMKGTACYDAKKESLQVSLSFWLFFGDKVDDNVLSDLSLTWLFNSKMSWSMIIYINGELNSRYVRNK